MTLDGITRVFWRVFLTVGWLMLVAGEVSAHERPMLSPVRVNPVLVHPEERRINLSGAWNFHLDPKDQGIRERWFDDRAALTEKIEVPGCWQGQGFGGDGNDLVWHFCQTRVFRATYKGTGWYGRTIEVPAAWKGARLWLRFGGVHPTAEVWLNGQKLGENHLPFVPFGFDVTDVLRFDKPNWLAVRVHEQDRIFGLVYNCQGNWSGLYRTVDLVATGSRAMEDLRIHADVDRKELRIKVRVGGLAMSDRPLTLRLAVQAVGVSDSPLRQEALIAAADSALVLPVPSPRLWSPDTPNLYRVDAVLSDGTTTLDAQSERVGFVKLAADGKQFRINGTPYYMRGAADFVYCPETGCPDTDRQRWRKKLKTLREYGYNHVRCQSYVYTPEYFDVADEVGLLIQSEMGMLGAWGMPGCSKWWPQPTPEYRDPLKRQWDLVVARDANHPSANLYCMSNELIKTTKFPEIAWQCYRDTKAIKPTAMVLWTDGGWNPDLPGDFVNVNASAVDKILCAAGSEPGDYVNPNAKASLSESCPKPLIQHEFQWWSSFPDVRIMAKYSGAMRPYGAKIAEEAAARRGLSALLPLAAANSQQLQFLEAKGKMEGCRRDFPQLAGICHFNAVDSNPSPQGILDEFYDRKLVDAATWRQTNGDTVILSSLNFGNRVLAGGDTLRCRLQVSDFSHPPLQRPSIRWEVVADRECLAHGEISYAHQAYRTCPVGEIAVVLPSVSRPVSAVLKATLHEGERTFTNQWNLWLFPKDAPLPESLRVYGTSHRTWLQGLRELPAVSLKDPAPGTQVVLTERFDESLAEFVRSGGRVIVVAGKGLLRRHPPLFGYIKYFFTPPANYPPYEHGQNATIFLKHPLLGKFPHQGFADLQCFRMIEESPPLDLEAIGLGRAEPVVRVVHRYPVCHPLAYLMECSLGKGGLVLCAFDLNRDWPEARYLLSQIAIHATSKGFRPAVALPPAGLQRILKELGSP